jgi:hypothetical protein
MRIHNTFSQLGTNFLTSQRQTERVQSQKMGPMRAAIR